ncbi:MAG TPA: PIN domain-containing protein [Conexibacter sp.]|jgi:predicted nucleic acid-binding protein|nr:PIN domain-containing protein [Conexibacter sp.]
MSETILCDTSFVSALQRGDSASWPVEVRDRLSNATLAMSVITLAELRAGHVYAGWGEARRARAEQLMASYVWIPLDIAILDEWARMSADCRRRGVKVPHNDMWIAASAMTRRWPLVSCDRDFDALPVEHIRLDVPGARPAPLQQP